MFTRTGLAYCMTWFVGSMFEGPAVKEEEERKHAILIRS